MNTIEKLGDEETFRNIVERTIPEFEDSGVEIIGSSAFSDCDALTSVSLPAATSIGENAFRDCNALTSVSLPVATSIGANAFESCNALTSVELPSAINIGAYAFASCSALTSVSLPAATSLVAYAFFNCVRLASVSLPAATSIGSQCFQNSALTRVSLPAITSIESYAFSSCSKLTTMYIGTESNTVCTLSSTNAIPSNVSAIYVPYNLQGKYKTATNWSSFASKIQGYEQPVACQSLIIAANDVAGYQTFTTIHWEATCTYSIEGMMQTGTMVFKGDVTSDTFGKNPSSDSSRSIEVSYTFLGKTATATITQGKYVGDPLGGTIFYIDDTADGVYEFYDAKGNVISSVAVGDSPAMYKVLTPGTKDKYYVCDTTLYLNSRWSYYKNGNYVYNNLGTGTAIGTGKTNTDTVMAADNGAYITSDSNGYPTIWYQLSQARSLSLGGNTDWFVPSKDEMNKVRTSGIIPFSGEYIWSSSEHSSNTAWYWRYSSWDNDFKNSYYSVFFVRAF